MPGTQYASLTDLYRLGIPAAAVSSTSDADKNAALLAASTLCDSYLGGRFKLPLSGYGDDLKLAVSKIAAYNLIGTRGMSPGNASSDALRDAYLDQMKWLKDISDGRATPAWPTTADVNNFNPNDAPFVLQPSSGSIGAGGVCLPPGTPVKPKLRGW